MKTKYRIVEYRKYMTDGRGDAYYICKTYYKIQYRNLFTIIFHGGWTDLNEDYYLSNGNVFLSYEGTKKFLDEWIQDESIKEKTDIKVVYEE